MYFSFRLIIGGWSRLIESVQRRAMKTKHEGERNRDRERKRRDPLQPQPVLF